MLNLAQEDWDTVAHRIENAEGPVAWSLMAVRERDEWYPLVLTVRGCRTTLRRRLRYPKVIIDTDELTPKEAAERFRSGTVQIEGRQMPFRVDGPTAVYWHTTERSGLHLTRGEWPRFVARFHRSLQNVNVPDRNDPLTAPGQAYYPNVMAAAAALVYGVQPAHLGNDLSANVTVVLPDRRARIADIRFTESTTVVHVERGRPDEGLLLRAAWRSEPEEAEWHSADMTIERDEIHIPTEGIAAHMSIAVVDRPGAVLDLREWDPDRQERPKDVPISPEQVQRWIAEGESTTMECKQELGSDGVHRSLAETVAAFANGDGGMILIGVTDDYRIVGYDPGFSVADQVTGIVDSLVNEPPTVRVESVRIEGMLVHVVRVEPSAPHDRPHMVRDRVYYRANARTRVAFPSEVRRMTRESDAHIHHALWS